MSHLGDEAEAFFKKGDEGTYEGGPLSMMPSSRDCAVPEGTDESLTTELIAGQLERRDRLQRLVTRIVGGLGVAVLLLVPLRLRANLAAAGAAESIGVITSKPLAAAPLPVQSPPATPVAAAPDPSVRLAPEAPGGNGDGSVVRVPAASKGHRRHGAAVHSQPQGNRRAVLVTRPTRTLAPAPPSDVHRRPSSHVPPTATFPD